MKKLTVDKSKLSSELQLVLEEIRSKGDSKNPEENQEEAEVLPPGRMTPWGYELFGRLESNEPKYFHRRTATRMVIYQLVYAFLTKLSLLKTKEQDEFLKKILDDSANFVTEQAEMVAQIDDLNIHQFSYKKVSFRQVNYTVRHLFSEFDAIWDKIKSYTNLEEIKDIESFEVKSLVLSVVADQLAEIKAWDSKIPNAREPVRDIKVVEEYMTLCRHFFDDSKIKLLNGLLVKSLPGILGIKIKDDSDTEIKKDIDKNLDVDLAFVGESQISAESPQS